MRRTVLAGAAVMSIGACVGEKITAPEMMELVSRWDSTVMQHTHTQLLYAWAPIPSFSNLPEVLKTPVEMDGRTVMHSMLIFERRFENGNWEAVNCLPPHHVFIMLWSETEARPGVDALIFHIGAEPGVMNRRLVEPTAALNRCGLTRSPRGGSSVIMADAVYQPSGGRPAIDGRIMVRRRAGASECAFVQSPAELEGWGSSCTMQRYDFEIEAILRPVESHVVSARGATRIRASSRNAPGAIFVTDCRKHGHWCHKAEPAADTTGTP